MFFAPDIFQPDPMRDIQAFLLLVYVIIGIPSLIYRYRNFSKVEERQQTQWVIFGFALIITGSLIINVGYFLLRQVATDVQAQLIYDFGLITAFGATAAIMFALIFGASIIRYRLWDLQPILTRITVHTFVTAILFLLAFFVLYLTKWFVVQVLGISSRLDIIVSLINPQIPGNDKKMGILELGPKSSGKGFSHDEIDFIRSIACEAALA
jgi:hypothetical protein